MSIWIKTEDNSKGMMTRKCFRERNVCIDHPATPETLESQTIQFKGDDDEEVFSREKRLH